MSGPGFSKLIYLAIIGGITTGIVFFSLRNLIALARLCAAKTSMGRILRKRIDSDDGNTYYVSYAFEDGAGQRHQREIHLGKSNFDRLQEGQSTNIAYQTGNPANSYLADPHFRRSRLVSMCAWLLLAAVLVYVIYSFVDQCVMRDICPSS